MPDTSPESLKALIQGITQANDSIVEAKVIRADPLKVQATNDEKLILSATSLIVPQHLTDYQTTATFALEKGNLDSQTDGDHTHHLVTFSLSKETITLLNALKKDDIVYMLPVNNGKKYFILDRRG